MVNDGLYTHCDATVGKYSEVVIFAARNGDFVDVMVW